MGWSSGPAYVTTTVATDPLVDAKGDLFIGTADNTAARLAVGANDTLLYADSTATPGVSWQQRNVHKRSTAIRENLATRKGWPGSQGTALSTTRTYFSSIFLQAGDVVTNINWACGNAVYSGTHCMSGLYDSALSLVRQSTDTLTVGLTASVSNAVTLDSVPATAGSRTASATVVLTLPTLNQALSALFAVNDSIVVSNANVAAYNGTFTVTAVSATQIQYVCGGSSTDSLVSPFPTVQMAAGKRTYTVPTSGLYYGALAQVAGTPNTLIIAGGTGAAVVTGQAPILAGNDATATIAGTLVSPANALTASSNECYFFIA